MHSHLKNGYPAKERVLTKDWREKLKSSKILKKVLEVSEKSVPLHPRSKNGSSQEDLGSSLKRLEIYTVQEASTEKY